ncbi:hypothetical protein AAFX91_38375 [Bradyrhizobium sp. 31Argb]|uniref:hypothetical protein n=1 Tax=Bradyrhizobium sp. 31Argb TaxID=3141247 RepID=UPI0037479DE7
MAGDQLSISPFSACFCEHFFIVGCARLRVPTASTIKRSLPFKMGRSVDLTLLAIRVAGLYEKCTVMGGMWLSSGAS